MDPQNQYCHPSATSFYPNTALNTTQNPTISNDLINFFFNGPTTNSSTPVGSTSIPDDPFAGEDWADIYWRLALEDPVIALEEIPPLIPFENQTTITNSPQTNRPVSSSLLDFNLNDRQPSSPLSNTPFLIPNTFWNGMSTETGGFSLRHRGFDNNSLSGDRPQYDELIGASVSVENEEFSLAQVTQGNLNNELQHPVGNAFQRAIFYFQDALYSLLQGAAPVNPLSPSETIQKIAAIKAFFEVSPVPHFPNTTANQAILEAVDGCHSIHVMDFDIGIGSQWPSLLKEVAAKHVCRGVRITAVAAEESMETILAKENLSNFAGGLGIQFQLELVTIQRFKKLGFAAIRFTEGETLVVNLSPTFFRHFGLPPSEEVVTKFLRVLRQLKPKIAVFIDMEYRRGCDTSAPASFLKNIAAGVEFYSSLMESLDTDPNAAGQVTQLIETYLVRPMVFQWVAESGTHPIQWRDLFLKAGMIPIPFSGFAQSQAEVLVSRTRTSGFDVVKSNCALVLSWLGKEMFSTSAWRFC